MTMDFERSEPGNVTESTSLKPHSNPWRWRAIVAVPVIIVVGLLIWRHAGSSSSHSPGGRSTAQTPQAVRVAAAATGDIPIVLEGLGTVTPLATVTVRTQISGQLMALGFREGQLVAKGDFLAQVDPRPYQVALEQDQGQLAHDQGLLAQAKRDLARYQLLIRQDSISHQQADDQRYLVQQYEGTVRADQGLVDGAKLNLAYCHIVAPVAGVVGLRQVDAGNFVQTSDTNGIVVITQLQPISVIFTLPEDDLPAVMSAFQSGDPLPVIAFDRSDTERLGWGTLAAVDNQVDTTTGTVKLRAVFSNADQTLYPDQFVNAKLRVKVVRNVVVVPSAAILNGAPGNFVYKVAADGTVSVVTVTLGPSDGSRTAISAGLSPGDQVVVDGTDRLKDGAKIAVIATPATASGSEPGESPGGGWKHHRRHHPPNGQPYSPPQE